MRAMALNPDDRYNSATDMLRDMEEFRKNPSIIFGKVAPEAAVPIVTPPVRRPAQNIAEQKAGYVPANNAPRRAKPKEKNNTGLIIAIVACAVVLIGAIILFASLNSCSSSKETESTEAAELHTVPNFVGMLYEDIDQSKYPYLTFKTEEENSDEDEGKVIRQSIDAEMEIKGDRTIVLTISIGQKTEKLIDLTGKTQDDAEKWLNDLKMDIKLVIEEENDDEAEAGKVLRTDPAAGTEISAGDTVTLYVSKGKESVEVPKVIGMNVSSAYSLLTGDNYKLKVEYEYKNDDSDKDTVIAQSISAGTKVDEGTTITLTVSAGPKETETTAPSPVTKTYTMSVDSSDQMQVLEVRQNSTVLLSLNINPNETEVSFDMSGNGTQYYDIYIGGTYNRTIKVNFDE